MAIYFRHGFYFHLRPHFHPSTADELVLARISQPASLPVCWNIGMPLAGVSLLVSAASGLACMRESAENSQDAILG